MKHVANYVLMTVYVLCLTEKNNFILLYDTVG